MHIHSLTTYPVKSLPGLPHASITLTSLGLRSDRIFALQRLDATPPQILHISHVPQLSLFTLSLVDDAVLRISHPPSGTTTSFPLHPPTADLPTADVTMHSSPCTAYIVLGPHTAFFSAALGFPVQLLYLGPSRRRVLGNLAPPTSFWSRWFSSRVEPVITFADCAAVLVTSMASLPEGVGMERFRANIVVCGEEVEAWEEDYWRVLKMPATGELRITGNCVRCSSLNVDFDTGGFLESGRQVLKVLQKDRRVDKGVPWSPVFGRYAFLVGVEEVVVEVGMQLEVTERYEERTRLRWPGISKDT